jgi:hypothetical protein
VIALSVKDETASRLVVEEVLQGLPLQALEKLPLGSGKETGCSPE